MSNFLKHPYNVIGNNSFIYFYKNKKESKHKTFLLPWWFLNCNITKKRGKKRRIDENNFFFHFHNIKHSFCLCLSLFIQMKVFFCVLFFCFLYPASKRELHYRYSSHFRRGITIGQSVVGGGKQRKNVIQ